MTLWPKTWRTRTLVVFVIALAVAHVLAAWGLDNGMPDAPYGDEHRRLALWIDAILHTVWMPWESLSADAVMPAALARGVIPITLLWLAGEGITHLFANVLRLRLALSRGGHYIIAGLSPFGIRLGTQWLKQDRAVIAICANEAETRLARSVEMGAVATTWGTIEGFERCALHKAETVLITGASDMANIESAKAATDFAVSHRAGTMSPLLMLLEVNDAFLRAQISERLDRFGHLESAQVRIISPAQIAARRLIRDHPFGRYALVASLAPHLWIVGAGRIGLEIAVSALRLAHFMHGKPVTVTIIDQKPEVQIRNSLLAHCPGLSVQCTGLLVQSPGIQTLGRVTLVEEDATRVNAWVGEALGRAGETGSSPTAIYLCLDSDEMNPALALKVPAVLREAKCAVPTIYVRRASAQSGVLSPDLADADWITSFGDVDWVADGALTTIEELDALARRIHERYLAEAAERGEALGSRRSLQPWMLLDEDLKDDNRSLADHHYVKIRDCGCRVLPASAASVPFAFAAEEVESLAETEHVRWMAARLISGWQRADVRDDGRKLHPDIVPYAELGENRKDLDRAVVRGLPVLFAELGSAIVRDVRIGVVGPRTHWGFAPEFDAAVAAELERLKRQAAERVIVLYPDLNSALACRVAEIALERRIAKVALVLSRSVREVLDHESDPRIKGRLRNLARAAETVRALGTGGPTLQDELRRVGEISWVLSIDGADMPDAPNVLGMDAMGRVLRKQEGALHGSD